MKKFLAISALFAFTAVLASTSTGQIVSCVALIKSLWVVERQDREAVWVSWIASTLFLICGLNRSVTA